MNAESPILVTPASARPVIDAKYLQLWKVPSDTVLLARRPGEVSDQTARSRCASIEGVLLLKRKFPDAGHSGHPQNSRELRAPRESVVRDGRLVRGHGEVTDECAFSVILS